jgi:hypothetical protein
MFDGWKLRGLFAAFTVAIVGMWLLTVSGSRDGSTMRSMTLAGVQRQPEDAVDAAVAPQSTSTQSLAPVSAPIAPQDRWKPAESTERSKFGLRFRVSQSVTEACALHELWNDCSKLYGFLERMRAEPRDAQWASEAEARIERATYEGERGQYRIRALECHSTRCVLEVVSESQTNGISYVAAYDDGLAEDTGAVASEDDPHTGIRTMVFVQIWQKRDTDPLSREILTR